MITGFQQYTEELTDYEKQSILPVLIYNLKNCIGVDNAISNKEILKKLDKMDITTTAPRIRKMIHHIRRKGYVNRLIATSKGYYVTTSKEELMKYVESLEQRESAIAAIRQSLIEHEKYLDNARQKQRAAKSEY
jgi:hypothetical protein